MVTMGSNRDVVLAAHNLKKIWTIPVNQLNAQELLARDMVIMTVEAARWAEETLALEPHGRRGAKWTNAAAASNGAAVTEPLTEEAPAEVVLAVEAADIEAPDSTEEESPVEEAPTPRPGRRGTTASPAQEPAAETPDPESPPAESPDEEA